MSTDMLFFIVTTDCSCSASRGRAVCRAAHPRPIANRGVRNVLAARGSHGADDARRRRSISSRASSLRSLTERDGEAGERGEVKEGAERRRTWPPTDPWSSLYADLVVSTAPPLPRSRSGQINTRETGAPRRRSGRRRTRPTPRLPRAPSLDAAFRVLSLPGA
jgi:hypothetical protein